jgi:hypothetical protein
MDLSLEGFVRVLACADHDHREDDLDAVRWNEGDSLWLADRRAVGTDPLKRAVRQMGHDHDVMP